MSDSLMTIYVEPDQCPSHHAILLTQGRTCEIFTKKFWELAILKNGHFWKTAILDFFSKKKKNFCFILMKISPNLHGIMDGLKFWCFLWFPENFLAVRNIALYSVPAMQNSLQFSTLKDKNVFLLHLHAGTYSSYVLIP